ncbi:MAG: 3-deoxy-7-phosphoheptulonate synthase [Bacteroidales bacterium]|nr:3-deoxy-7-phosphoheptulonate synthase [Bacteroidales bacterium]
MNLDFKRKLLTPKEIKEMYPLREESVAAKARNDAEIKAIFTGESDKLLLVIGPCSADREDAVIEYITRLREVQEKVKDVIKIIPRVYTNKPRTTGDGYKGMLHQPDPTRETDMLKGLISIRKMHMKVVSNTGFTCADEMLYPENHRYLSDILSYVAVGARSVEDQTHRLVASGLNIPVGMKNPTSGDMSVMINSIHAANGCHTFIYRGWEVQSKGNPFAHAILRGSVNKLGNTIPNYHYEDITTLYEKYLAANLPNPAVIIDTNHANSGKKADEQIRISKEIINSIRLSGDIRKFVKGLMIESYLEDGNQKTDGCIYGKSITDPCIGWEKTERLIYDIAEMR